MAEVSVSEDDDFLELCQLLREAREILAEEREVMLSSYREQDGTVRDPTARRAIAKYDRWLKRSKKVLPP